MKINDIYKCSGKKYNGEKAIISLTSWKARVGSVGKTLFSLIKQCPGFHIVLVLSEEEFPKMEEELLDELMLFVKNNLIELLWVNENYRSHKKYFYTMHKYSELPIILVDDDLIYYTTNNKGFGDNLYDEWKKHPSSVICSRTHLIKFDNNKNILPYKQWKWGISRYSKDKKLFLTSGAGTLFPPNFLQKTKIIVKDILDYITADDILLNIKCIQYNIERIHIQHNYYKETNLHDTNSLWSKNSQGLNDNYIKKSIDIFKKVL